SAEYELTCFMCLQIYSYPVSLSCSHSFCLKCIQDHFKYRDDTEKYSCPECYAKFEEKPRLLKNTDLSEQVLHLVRGREQSVFCDYCLEEEAPATMSCLQCEASFCVAHLRPHNEKAYLQSHVMVEPSEMMALRRCKVHREMLKLFCRDHRTCICTLCSLVGEHKQHAVCTVEEAKMEEENAYSAFHEQAVHHYKGIKAVLEEDEVLTLRFIDSERQVAINFIESQTKQKVEELDDIERTIQQIHIILNQTDAVRFLKGSNCNSHRIQSLLKRPEAPIYETTVDEGKLSSLMKTIIKLSNSLTKQGSCVRKALLSYATTITLDPATANEHLILSEDRTIVRYTDETLKAPYGPKRFDDTLYVMGSEGFNFGRHYWEVITRSKTDWEIGLAYASLPRKGKTWLGRNNSSWSLECNGDRCMVWHNNISIRVSINYKLERVGVYLDYTGGTIAFYDAEKISLLHSFHNKFTEAIYPVLNPCNSKGGNFAPLTVLQLKGLL
ncbi:zinc-binding protein A33-like, partial [Polypterus senegalus]|uniref:zinc-binding protein A33-like n=1 Tax=Polypterus senegalus TaxID=55291 RepID=UPI0019661433